MPHFAKTARRAPGPAPARTLLVAGVLALALAGTGARAQDEEPVPEVETAPQAITGSLDDAEPDTIAGTLIDQSVYETLLPNANVTRRALVDHAIAATLAQGPGSKPKSIVPTTVAAANAALKPIRLASGAIAAAPTTLAQLDGGQLVQVHAEGLPGPNAPDRDPLVRVLPRAVNPADVTFGARWGVQDRIQAPLLSQISWDAQADLLAGAPPPRAGNVRRSLRVTAQWDTPEDLTIGFTPGWQRGGGMIFEHYVTSIQASTVDKTQAAHWRTFLEVSGEKLAPNNIIDNSTAQVHAGASYLPSSSTQLDFSVSRGTLANSTDLTSSLGLSLHF